MEAIKTYKNMIRTLFNVLFLFGLLSCCSTEKNKMNQSNIMETGKRISEACRLFIRNR